MTTERSCVIIKIGIWKKMVIWICHHQNKKYWEVAKSECGKTTRYNAEDVFQAIERH